MTNPDFAAPASEEVQPSEPHTRAVQVLKWAGNAFAFCAVIVTVTMAWTTEFHDYRIVLGLLVFGVTIAVGIRLGLRFFACLAPLCFFAAVDLMPEGGVMHSFQFQLAGTAVCSQAVMASFTLKPFGVSMPEPQRRRALKQLATLVSFSVASLVLMYWGIITR